MSERYLHVISFNIPFPADYGGVIDIFYKLKALADAGVRVILHCYAYGRKPAKELEELCFRVHYYDRLSGVKYFLKKQPYIVVTRDSNFMPERILRDDFPVLFEGLHSTSLLSRCAAAGKKTLVRAHNIEHNYYRSLARIEERIPHKVFLYTESLKLKRYEGILKHADHILAISRTESDYSSSVYGNAVYLPAFHRFEEVRTMPGKGDYILFHGNLGVPENSDVFLRIAKNVLSKTDHRVIVAGKNPSNKFIRAFSSWSGIEVVANPDDRELDNLIRNAQVNLLYTAQATGIKLKLLHALFAGRHCLVNREMIEGTGLDELCVLADHPDQMVLKLDELMDQPFTEEQVLRRKEALQQYSNRAGAETIAGLLG
jgi:hypothetical protein